MSDKERLEYIKNLLLKNVFVLPFDVDWLVHQVEQLQIEKEEQQEEIQRLETELMMCR
jgi:hypothetical protein